MIFHVVSIPIHCNSTALSKDNCNILIGESGIALTYRSIAIDYNWRSILELTEVKAYILQSLKIVDWINILWWYIYISTYDTSLRILQVGYVLLSAQNCLPAFSLSGWFKTLEWGRRRKELFSWNRTSSKDWMFLYYTEVVQLGLCVWCIAVVSFFSYWRWVSWPEDDCG